jgi:5-(carboxyamino)imidazole ribonucleotide mutase
MGSENDWPKINGVKKALDEFGVECEVSVMSAHRTPNAVADYAGGAKDRGIQVLICAAGGAAHLAGVAAAFSTLPVIGIPVMTEMAGGLDSLLSMVQMPGDVPVAVVAAGAGGPRNAGLLAVQMMALADPELAKKLIQYKKDLCKKVEERNAKLQASL